MQFIIGVLVGIAIASVGFSGVAKILDRGVEAVKTQTQELSK
jgi:hypothetical protein